MKIIRKPGKKKLIALLASLGIVTVGMFVFPRGGENMEPSFQLEGATADQRVAFLAQFGWEVEAEPLEIREVVIPETFDDVYNRYNALQQEQGMDLLPYAGKTCKQWIYRITNYPLSGEEVRAVLLVYDGVVIGGDISSVELNGFMTGFSGETEEGEISQENTEETEETEDTAAIAEEIAEDAWPTD